MQKIGTPFSFIRLGLKGTFEGTLFTVVGRARFSGTIREWDEEDKAYASEPWEYDEWYLIGNGKTLVITEDSEGFDVGHPIQATVTEFPQPDALQMTLFADREPQPIQEWGNMKIVGWEGKPDEEPQEGRVYAYVQYEADGRTYSVEQERDEQGRVLQTTFFEDRELPAVFLADALGVANTFVPAKEESSNEEQAEAQPRRSKRKGKRVGKIYSLFWLILVAVIFLSGCFGSQTCDPQTRDENGRCPQTLRNIGRRSFSNGGFSSGK